MATGRQAKKVSKRVYRKALKTPKKILAKKYANTVGQIVRRKKGKRTKPSRGFRKKTTRRRSKRRY